MKIFDEVKGFVNRSKVIQTFLTLYKWGKRINSHWDNLVRNTGSKYDILRVPLAIFMVTTVFLLGYLPANAWAVGTADEHNIWVAYTVGDVSFMHSVLRAVSMIMYGDGGVIQGAYRLACLLGIIWLIVKGIFSKQVIDIGSGFFVIFFYMCFFVPQSTLHIEDLQTKKYYTMEKIPLGVSVTLSLTSRIGKYFTDAYETVFVESSADSALCSAGSMNCNGYMGTLDMIAKARSSLQNHAAYLAINKAMCNGSEDISSCDIERSILNYTKDCTVQKLMSPTERFTLKNVTGFKVNGDTQKEMKFNSKRHYTKVYAGPGKDGVMNCLEAGNFIATALENNRVKTTIYNMAFPHHNLTTAGGAVNDGGSGTDNGTREGTYDVAAMQTDMDAALGGLGGQTADSYEYLKNVLIRPLMEKGLRDGFIDQNQLSAQIALDTAISQRNLQLAAESSMFATMIRPLTTFLEGFVLALTPLMPFILLLGINAFGVVMKYLLVLFWIQLWAPALAICNMYVQNVVKENLALALGGTDITSFTGIETATPVIQHWLAVGGMMGASVPVLTLFILSGSIYTFNTLATSIKGGDHFDEKAIQPDAMKRAAFINTSVGSYNISSGAGSTEDGTSSAYARITSSEMANISESAAHAEKVAKSNQYLNAVIHGMSNSTSAQHNRAIVRNLAQQWASKDA
uniref:conjugal transfer protein TraG N-terminal domain-containing protein n=1 Tax=Ruminobacter amylophilus TaxID=867 RepID=UPI003865B8DE